MSGNNRLISANMLQKLPQRIPCIGLASLENVLHSSTAGCLHSSRLPVRSAVIHAEERPCAYSLSTSLDPAGDMLEALH